MMRKRTSVAALVAVLWAAPLASQQASLSLGQVQQIAVAALEAGNTDVAIQAADALLTRDPADPGALILRTEAAILSDDFAGAVSFGRRAYWNANSDLQRFSSARLVALAHARQQQDTRAQTWLRLARQVAPNERQSAAVAQDFRTLRARNPLSINLRFGITPTTNVNNGSAVEADEAIDFLGLPFILSGDARALSGWEVSANTSLRYRIRDDATSATFIDASFSGRTYILTESAEDQAGDGVRGSDFSDANLSFGVTHRFILAEGMRPTTAGLSYGKSWYGGDPNVRVWTASASHSWEISPKDTFTLSGFGQDQNSLRGRDSVQTYQLQGTWARDLSDLGNVGISLAVRDSQSNNLDSDYDSIRLGLNYAFPEPIVGMQFSVNYTYEERDYDGSNFGARDIDVISSAAVTAVFTDVEYFGFQPLINIEHTVQSSDANLFDREYTNIGFDITSSF